MNNTIYLDHAAATPVRNEVWEAMLPFAKDEFANPSSLYAEARVTRGALDAARASVAKTLGARPPEITFTAGTTESINLALQGVARKFPGKHIVTATIEHDAVLETARALQQQGMGLTIVQVKPGGQVDADTLAQAIGDETVIVSVAYANNEIGSIQPLRDVVAAIEDVRKQRQAGGNDLPIYLHSDAAQVVPYLSLQVARLGVDLMSFGAGKFYGPKQSGVLYVRHGVELEPLMYGGGQERGLRSGTENVAACVGLAKALDLAQEERKTETNRLQQLRDQLWRDLQSAVPKVMLNGDMNHRLPNNLNVTVPGLDGEAAVLYLDKAGVQTSTGSACSVGNDEPSHVLLAIGLSPEQANASLRFTMGRSTTAEDITRATEVIIDTLKHLQP